MPYVGQKPADIISTAVDTVTGKFSGDIDASTINATGDTAAGDNAAMGFTSAEGLILTGQGSTNDITLKNDADAVVFSVPTGTDDILFPDNAKILMGAGSDLQIYHDGSNSAIVDNGTGEFLISTNGTFIRLGTTAGEAMIDGVKDGAATLYHNNVAKLATASGGVTVTGGVTTTTASSIEGGVVFNEASADVDFRVESDNLTHALFVQGSDGNVSIGATSPTTPLFINRAVADHTSTAITLQNSQDGGYGGQIIFKSAQTNGTLLTGASIGIEGAAAWNSTGNTSSNLKFSTMGGGTLAEKMRILSNGGLCINRTNQANSERLAITGNSSSQAMSLTSPITGAYDMVNLINGNGQVGRIGTDGSASQFVTSSDYRLKENVSYSFDATSRLKQLKPARFNFIADEDNTLVDGFIAHEVSSIVPEAISGKKDAMAVETRYTEDDVETQGDNPTKSVGDIKTYSSTVIDPQGIDQSKIVPLLTKTILELEARITALESA